MANINPRAVAALAADHMKRSEAEQAARRERERKSQLAAYIQTATSSIPYYHGDRLESAAQVEIAHRGFEKEFFAAIGIMDDTKVGDAVLVQVAMSVLRQKAREYANSKVWEAAERFRMAKLRSELIQDSTDTYDALLAKSLEVLSGLGSDNMKANFAVNKRIAERTRFQE